MSSLAQDDSQQRAELRIAFIKHLPKRLQQLARRGHRYCTEGWDINGLSVLHDDVQRLAGVAGRYGELEVSQTLHSLEGLLGLSLKAEQLPSAEASEQMLVLFDTLAPERGAPAARDQSAAQAASLHRAEASPSHYWRRWVADNRSPLRLIGSTDPAPSGLTLALEGEEPEPLPAPISAPAAPARPARPAPVARPINPAAPSPAPAAPAARKPTPAARQTARIYHLTDAGELSLELDQKLESLGYELELLENADELKEVLTALAPDLVVVDAEFLSELEDIGAVLRVTRERTGTKLPLLAISAEDNVPARLTARRAGADALLIAPRSTADVLQKLQELLETGNEETYRVLIVEDDRSQGLFAESILRNAGMEAKVIGNAFEVLDAMDQFRPDLVLMDLYMPDCDGTELTALIRERDEFLHTPIVFLSGESDIDKHYQALDAGGDDFLSKPIRPKHLISAVSNRVRRARAMLRRVSTRDPKDALTGLFTRSYTLERLNELLGSEDARSRPGGALFFDLDGVAALRDKLGLSHVEGLLGEAGTMIAKELDGIEFACRYGDGCFVAVCPERPDGSMESLATDVRNQLRSHSFSVAGRPVRLRVSVGVAPFRFGFADAGSLLNAGERCAREARGGETGVLRFDPPKRGEVAAEDSLTTLIRQAIDRDGFELLYQPIVAVQGSEESQFQTLLRLRDDQGRLHTAAEIIPIAERADLMSDVDRWVMSQAMRMIELRRQAGNPVRLFVNQSATTLASAGHADWISHQLKVRNIPGTELTLELTLEDIDTYIDAIVQFCETLIPSGVHFCLSRFETGERGEAVLEKLPVDFVKLSARYLATLQTQGTRDALRGIVDRAHRRGLQVIAQRVEDAQSAATLWMSGVDFIQGNLVQQAGRELNFDFQSAVL